MKKWQEWLDQKQGQVFRYKLEKMDYALECLGNPQKKHPVIHVAGSNGKGSTVAFLTELGQRHGLKVGSFVSPHLVTLHDRIRVNGRPIGQEDFECLAEEVYQLEVRVKEKYEIFSYFEVMTLIMFLFFSRQDLDFVLVEVGIGGLLDTTNVVTPLVSVITSIGLDHQEILGDTLEEIAFQKAGIIKEGCPVVLGPVCQEAQQVVERFAQDKAAKLLSYGREFYLQEGVFEYQEIRFSSLEIGLKGQHQRENAAVALVAFLLYMEAVERPVFEDLVREALRATRWAGRMEKVESNPDIYVDGAHNLPAIQRFIEYVKEEDRGQTTILFAALERKDGPEMLQLLKEELPHIPVVKTSFTYQGVKQQLATQAEDIVDYREFLENWRIVATSDACLLVTGSLYFVSEIRAYLLEKGGL